MPQDDDIELENLRATFPAGRRVRLLRLADPEPTELALGSEGTVVFVDSLGTIHVDWDSGVRLGVLVRAHHGRAPDGIVALGGGPRWPSQHGG